MNYHKSVLLKEAVDVLKISRGKKYIDATLGGGGHTSEIIKKGGIVLGIDQDQDAIDFVSQNQKEAIESHELRFAKGNFSDIDEIAKENGFEIVSGILLDLGVSSHQLDTAERGFSYLKSGPLDMRMDAMKNVKASDLLNVLGKNELAQIFMDLGEEYKAHMISEQIVNYRKTKLFETTDDLVEVLSKAYGFKSLSDFAKAESSKKVFQALRIQVNNELGVIDESLPKALEILESGGRVVVITFHSLEDRIVKKLFIKFEIEGKGVVITKKPIVPSELEIFENSRSKSAKMRVFEKI